MSIMFANRQQPAGTGHLLEFQAGRTLIEPGSTPEKRKAVAVPDQGLIYVRHSQDDQLLHFCWKDRQTNKIELDLIVFPGETEFLRINECKDGRVFMLKFKNSQERHLFWMQEPNEDKDAELAKKMNDLLSNAPPTRTQAATAQPNRNQFSALNQAIGGNLEDIGALSNMDQNQLMRLFSLMNGSGNAADLLPQLVGSTPNSTNPNQAVPMNPLAALLGQPTTKQSASGGDGSKEGTQLVGSAQRGGTVNAQMLSQIINAIPTATTTDGGQKRRPAVELSTVLTRGNTQEVVEKYKDDLLPHLPNQEGHNDPKTELSQTVGNPQFQQTVDFVGQTIQTGQMSAALEQFKLNKSVVDATKKGDLVEFAEKLTAQQVDKKIEEEADQEENAESVQKKEEAEGKEAKENKPEAKGPPPKEDDNMDLD